MSLPAITHSYSSLSAYTQCPESMRHLFILKDFKKTWTVKGGIDAHRLLEGRLKKHAPLPPELQGAEAFCQSLEADGTPVECEVSLAVTHEIEPTSFWHPTAWLRGKFDVIKRNPDKRKAFIGDWKTGKRRESDEQLAIGADMLMATDQSIDTVTGANIWLSDGGLGTPYVFTRQEKSKRWAPLIKRLREIEARNPAHEWEKREGPLCRYCPVKTCSNYCGG